MSKARELASLGNAYSDGALSNRNLIINGAMQVWQRGTSSTSTNTLVSVDRFYAVNTTKFDRSTDTPPGFQYSLLLGNSSAHFPYADQRIEAATMKQVEGKPLTISFWAKASSPVPNLFVEFVSPSAEDNYSTQTIRFNQAWASPSSSWTYYQATYASPHVEFLNGASIRIGLQNQGAGDLYITGVQLEVGDTATPFEHRSYGQELALCQRYYKCGSTRLCFSEVPGRYGFAQVDAHQYRTTPSCSYTFTSSGYGTVLAVGSFQPNGTTYTVDVQTAPSSGMDGIINWTADAEL